jgi:2-methylcitrate dehydratase PrpD
MLVRGHVSVSDFTDAAIADPDVLAVAGRVRYETRDYPTYPQAFPGGATVRLADGTSFEADFPYQKGGPENPLTAGEVRAKFCENAALALSDGDAAALEETILALDEIDDLGAALQPLTLAAVAA